MAATKPKLYDFRFTLRKVSFGAGYVTAHYGESAVYLDVYERLTFEDALERLRELSKQEPRSHAAKLRMKNSNDRKPALFDLSAPIYHNQEAARAKDVLL